MFILICFEKQGLGLGWMDIRWTTTTDTIRTRPTSKLASTKISTPITSLPTSHSRYPSSQAQTWQELELKLKLGNGNRNKHEKDKKEGGQIALCHRRQDGWEDPAGCCMGEHEYRCKSPESQAQWGFLQPSVDGMKIGFDIDCQMRTRWGWVWYATFAFGPLIWGIPDVGFCIPLQIVLRWSYHNTMPILRIVSATCHPPRNITPPSATQLTTFL